MKKLQEILAEVAQFRNRRCSLVQNLKALDGKQCKMMEKLQSEHISKLSNFEHEREAAIIAIESRAKKEISVYVQMKSSFQKYIEPVKQWCSKADLVKYGSGT